MDFTKWARLFARWYSSGYIITCKRLSKGIIDNWLFWKRWRIGKFGILCPVMHPLDVPVTRAQPLSFQIRARLLRIPLHCEHVWLRRARCRLQMGFKCLTCMRARRLTHRWICYYQFVIIILRIHSVYTQITLIRGNWFVACLRAGYKHTHIRGLIL